MHGAGVAQAIGCAGAVLAVGLNAPQARTSCLRRKVAGGASVTTPSLSLEGVGPLLHPTGCSPEEPIPSTPST